MQPACSGIADVAVSGRRLIGQRGLKTANCRPLSAIPDGDEDGEGDQPDALTLEVEESKVCVTQVLQTGTHFFPS